MMSGPGISGPGRYRAGAGQTCWPRRGWEAGGASRRPLSRRLLLGDLSAAYEGMVSGGPIIETDEEAAARAAAEARAVEEEGVSRRE